MFSTTVSISFVKAKKKREKEEAEKWKNVPAWKRKLMMEKAKEQEQMSAEENKKVGAVRPHLLSHLVHTVGMRPKLGRKSQQTFVIKLGRSQQALVITLGKLSRHAPQTW